MRVFVVGASGVIGSRLVPQLIERGHEVSGSTRSLEKAGRLRRLGAESVALSKRLVPISVATEPNPPADAEDRVAALRRLEDGVTP